METQKAISEKIEASFNFETLDYSPIAEAMQWAGTLQGMIRELREIHHEYASMLMADNKSRDYEGEGRLSHLDILKQLADAFEVIRNKAILAKI